MSSTGEIMNRFCFWGFIAVGLVLSPKPVLAQDTLPFKDAIRNFAESREGTENYELSLTINERGRPSRATNGVVNPAVDEPVVTLEIAADQTANRRLVAEYQLQDGANQLQGLHVRTPQFSIHVQNAKGSISHPSNRRMDGHFDPLAFGIAPLGDMHRGSSLHEIAEYYMEWPSLESRVMADKTVRYGEDDGRSSYLLFLDPERGYSPVRLRDRTGNKGTFNVSLKLISKKGFWLPLSAVVEEPERTRTLQFDWRSINSDIDDRFDPQKIESKYGLNLRDNRLPATITESE
ncbi:hypothetical protein [Rhodopirellula bahusiensis]|uniref:hypothetical protein n=1 Tax=Rhodopirellula bahusiensis TaxID=2014065 RepID=UPI003267E837